jgi:predicted DNA-binding protein (UPF0251 family)
MRWFEPMVKKVEISRHSRRPAAAGDDAAKVLGVSRRTMFRGLKAAREHDELASAGAL